MDGITLLDENSQIVPDYVEKWTNRLKGFDSDILIVGHTHQVFAQQLGKTTVINPGSTKFNHTCMILSLPDIETKIVPLGDKQPILAWNWGTFHSRKSS